MRMFTKKLFYDFSVRFICDESGELEGPKDAGTWLKGT